MKALFLLLIILSLPTFGFATVQTDVLFILYDAGETLALKPVIDELGKKNVDFKVLVMGTARQIMGPCQNCIDIQTSCGTKEKISQEDWPRERILDLEDLKKVKNCIHSKILVSGSVSEVQQQMSREFKNTGSLRITYDDNFSSFENDPIVLKFLKETDEFWVTTETLAKVAQKIEPQKKIYAVGQPSLEKWELTAKRENVQDIWSSMPGLTHDKKVILYAGSYGEGYESALNLFLQGAAELPNYQYILSLHPKVDGTLEKKMTVKYPQVKILLVPKSVGTMKAALISDLIVSQSSTVGIQGLFINKPAIYLDNPGSQYTNFAIENGWAKQVFSKENFENAVQATLKNSRGPIDIYSLAKIPKSSTHLIMGLLIKDLSYKNAFGRGK